MADITDKKYFSYQITQRFLFAMDRILGSRGSGKVTAKAFGEIVGIDSSNLIRLRKNAGEQFVTVEAIGRLCHHYKISSFWLLTGQGDLYSNDELAAAYRTLDDRLREVESSLHSIELMLPELRKMVKKKG